MFWWRCYWTIFLWGALTVNRCSHATQQKLMRARIALPVHTDIFGCTQTLVHTSSTGSSCSCNRDNRSANSQIRVIDTANARVCGCKPSYNSIRLHLFKCVWVYVKNASRNTNMMFLYNNMHTRTHTHTHTHRQRGSLIQSTSRCTWVIALSVRGDQLV